MKEIDKLVEQHRQTCRYFNGIHNACCKAGINYRERFGEIIFSPSPLPCIRDEKPAKVSCINFESHSEDELADYRKAMTTMLADNEVISPFMEKVGKESKAGTAPPEGVRKCPLCGGDFSYLIAMEGWFNIISGYCATEGCIENIRYHL